MSRFTLTLAFIFLSSVAALAQTGGPAADFSAVDLKGEEVSLEGLRGKVVVLNFWSTRCAICHHELPNLNKLVGEFKDRDVVFLAVTMENESRVAPYLKANRFDFNIVPNGFGVLLKYADKGPDGTINMPFPSFFVIGPDGQLEFRTAGGGRTPQVGGAVRRLLDASASAN
jgi:peroxiredoxin